MAINIDNPKDYKPCRKKIYEIYVCKPPLGTCVINKLEQADVVKAVGGKTWFSAEDMQVMALANPKMFEFLRTNAYIVDANKRYVLGGTLGEMWTIDEAKLCQKYSLADDTILTPQAILKRCYYSEKSVNEKLTGKVDPSKAAIFKPTNKTLEAH